MQKAKGKEKGKGKPKDASVSVTSVPPSPSPSQLVSSHLMKKSLDNESVPENIEVSKAIIYA